MQNGYLTSPGPGGQSHAPAAAGSTAGSSGSGSRPGQPGLHPGAPSPQAQHSTAQQHQAHAQQAHARQAHQAQQAQYAAQHVAQQQHAQAMANFQALFQSERGHQLLLHLGNIVHGLRGIAECLQGEPIPGMDPGLMSAFYPVPPHLRHLHGAPALQAHSLPNLPQQPVDPVALPEARVIRPVKPPRKVREKRDAAKPRPPLSSYMLFCNDRRAGLKTRPDLTTQQQVAVELGKQWREASLADKEPYNAAAARAREKFRSDVRDYEERKSQDSGAMSGTSSFSTLEASSPSLPTAPTSPPSLVTSAESLQHPALAQDPHSVSAFALERHQLHHHHPDLQTHHHGLNGQHSLGAYGLPHGTKANEGLLTPATTSFSSTIHGMHDHFPHDLGVGDPQRSRQGTLGTDDASELDDDDDEDGDDAGEDDGDAEESKTAEGGGHAGADINRDFAGAQREASPSPHDSTMLNFMELAGLDHHHSHFMHDGDLGVSPSLPPLQPLPLLPKGQASALDISTQGIRGRSLSEEVLDDDPANKRQKL